MTAAVSGANGSEGLAGALPVAGDTWQSDTRQNGYSDRKSNAGKERDRVPVCGAKYTFKNKQELFCF